MVKSEVIKHLHKKYPELNRAHVETIVDIFFDTIIDSLAKGKSFEARQFGRFSVKTIKEKKMLEIRLVERLFMYRKRKKFPLKCQNI